MGISLVPLILKNDRARYLKRDIVGRASFKRRFFLFRDWQWKFIYFAELEQQLLGYLKRVEGKTYRPLLTSSLAP
jgi:hypothetical protein